MFKYIRLLAKEKEISIDTINGFEDHIHILIRLNPTQSIAKVMQLIKGESAYWSNKTNLSTNKIEWATGYYAASVSPNALDITRKYIRNQELHHLKSIQQYLKNHDIFKDKTLSYKTTDYFCHAIAIAP